MISPESYYEENLKGKTAEQIMTAIRGLKNEIGHLKNALEDPNYDFYDHVCPDEHTRLSCCFEYLERAKLALIEAGGVYTPSKAEQKAKEFDESIPLINKIVFSIGGYFEGFETKTITFDENNVCMDVEHSLLPKPSAHRIEGDHPMTKAEFISGLYELHIGEWRRRYYDNDIDDGTQWDLEIYYSDDRKPIKIFGSNEYPYNFNKLKDLFGCEK